MDQATWVKILDESVCISHSTHTFGKAMIATNFPQLWLNNDRQTGLFNLGMASSLGDGKVWIQTSCTPLCIASCLW